MRSTEHDRQGRRLTPLRVAVAPEADESLPGLVVRAVAENVLVQTMHVLSGADRLLHPGAVGMMPPERLRALAHLLGCGEDQVLRRAHPYVEQGRSRGGPVDFGGVPLLREDLLLERRRIAPKTLGDAGHHRGWWLLGLLPYCPLSGERLVDHCPRCLDDMPRALGWRQSWGMATCERCERPVPPADDAPLRDDLYRGYRLFADLVSIDDAVRDAALGRLPQRVRALPSRICIDLALQLGATCRSEPLTVPRPQVAKLPVEVLAEVVAVGADMLAYWPDALRSWTADEFARVDGDPDGIARVRRTLRRPGLPHTADPDQMAIYREALPNLFGSFQRSSADPVRWLVAGETSRRTGLGFDQLRLLRLAGLLRTRVEYRRSREHRQYDPAQVDALARALRGCVPASRAEWRLGLPGYAIEQMVCEGLLAAGDHPALTVVRPGLQLTASGIDYLERAFGVRARGGSPPAAALALRTAVRRIGGRLKPWSAIMASLLDGSVPFWLAGTGRLVRRVHVLPTDLARFSDLIFYETAHPNFAFAPRMPQKDAMEVLNVDAPEMHAISAEGLLKFEGQGTSLQADRAAVLELAQAYVWTAELGSIVGARSNILPAMLDRRGVERKARGWRRSVIDAVVPGLSLPRSR